MLHLVSTTPTMRAASADVAGYMYRVSGPIDRTTAPKAKKRKTEQPEEAEDDEEVEGEDDKEVDAKDLEDDEADAGEEDADEDVSSCLAATCLSGLDMKGNCTDIAIRLPTLLRPVALRLLPKRPRAKTCPRRLVSARLTMPSKYGCVRLLRY
jgi:hypothetical protein